MELKPMLFLSAVLLPSVLAFKVTFQETKEVAEYKLLPVTDKNLLKDLQGSQGVVRFATVISSTENQIFKEGSKVAVKIYFPDKLAGARSEQKAHTYIRHNAPGGIFEDIVRAEPNLGESEDLHEDSCIALPKGKYCVLIMEALGKNLLLIAEERNGFTAKENEAIYDWICAALSNLRKIKFSHGDVKPQNILLRDSNDFNQGICLVDLGLAVFVGSDQVTCGGDSTYISPIQALLQRPANCDDSDVSGVFSIVYIAKWHLPWIAYNDDVSDKFVNERILVSKYDFIKNPFHDHLIDPEEDPISPGLKDKVVMTLKNATDHEIGIIEKCIDTLRPLCLKQK